MESRNPFSKLKKKVKYRLTGKKQKPNKTGADAGEESVDLAGPRPGSAHPLVVGGSHDQQGNEPNTDGGQGLSTIRLPQPDEPGSMPGRGSGNDQERGGTDVDRGEVEQTHSHLHSDVEVGERSGPAEGKDIGGKTVEQAGPSTATTSIPRDGKPDST